MKIAVICANGKEGTLITWEAIARGADVTAVVRSENLLAAKKGHGHRKPYRSTALL